MPTGSSEQYWTSFSIQDHDLETLYGYLIERAEPVTARELLARMVEQRVAEEEKRREQLTSNARYYQPRAKYEVGQHLVFTALDHRQATIQAVRPSDNPRVLPFEVISVQFSDDGSVREFAAGFDRSHPLNEERSMTPGGAELKPEQVIEQYGDRLLPLLVARLQADKEFVQQDGRWLLRGLLAPIHEGHRNLAEAVIEQTGDAVPTTEMVRVLELAEGPRKGLIPFSLDYALGQDPQFEDVGPKGEHRWYLVRLVPPEAVTLPPMLGLWTAPGAPRLSPELESLRVELEGLTESDAWSQPVSNANEQHTLVLTYPHRRAGTLPLNASLAQMLPPFDRPRIKLTLIDGQTNARSAGFAVREGHYIAGLKNWYDSRKLHPGALVYVRPGPEPLTLVVDYAPQRERSLWVRVTRGLNGHLNISQEKRPIAHKYDEDMLMVIGDANALDTLAEAARRNSSLEQWLVEIVPELAKLTSAGRVHAKTLFAAVSILRRVTPAAFLAALSTAPALTSTGGGYFVLESVRDLVR